MRAPNCLCASFFAVSLSSSAWALPMVQIARPVTDHHSAATLASDTADYIRNAAIGDMFAIAAARVAQKKSHNYDVQRFAQMAIDDNRAFADALTLTLKQAEFAMTLPALLDTEHAQLVKQLEATPQSDFDASYMQQQIMAHQSALRVHASYAKNGRDQSLRQYAGQAIPKIRLQLTLAERIFEKISPKTAALR